MSDVAIPKDEVDLTAERLRELLHYDPGTGVFTWVRPPHTSHIKAGAIAGTAQDARGAWLIHIDKRAYMSSRLAWLYVTGEWPRDQINHINGISGDDRFANLREATRSQNRASTKRPKNNTSGFKGVSWHNRKRPWQARIQVNHQSLTLGYFDTPEEAHGAYCAAAHKYFGEFARVS